MSDEPEKRLERNLLLAATGSVATIKLPLLISKLKEKYEDKVYSAAGTGR